MIMDEIRLIGTTTAGGTTTIVAERAVYGYLARITWVDGDLVDGVDAILSLIQTPAGINETLWTFTDANDDAIYYPGSSNATWPSQLLNGTLSLAITSGGATKTGGAIIYISPISVDVTRLSALDCATVAEYNVTLTNASTEFSQALPANCRKLILRCRTADTVRYAWATGKVATPTVPYQTLRASAEYALDGINVASGIIYLASATAGVVVEMEAWS